MPEVPSPPKIKEPRNHLMHIYHIILIQLKGKVAKLGTKMELNIQIPMEATLQLSLDMYTSITRRRPVTRQSILALT